MCFSCWNWNVRKFGYLGVAWLAGRKRSMKLLSSKRASIGGQDDQGTENAKTSLGGGMMQGSYSIRTRQEGTNQSHSCGSKTLKALVRISTAPKGEHRRPPGAWTPSCAGSWDFDAEPCWGRFVRNANTPVADMEISRALRSKRTCRTAAGANPEHFELYRGLQQEPQVRAPRWFVEAERHEVFAERRRLSHSSAFRRPPAGMGRARLLRSHWHPLFLLPLDHGSQSPGCFRAVVPLGILRL